MKNLTLASVSILVLVGCKPAYINAEFKPYYQYLEANYQISLNNVAIDFGTMPDSSTVGICYEGSGNIEISQTFWATADAATRRVLISHEVGHCYFKKDHTSAKRVDNCPVSVMNPYVFGNPCYDMYAADMLDMSHAPDIRHGFTPVQDDEDGLKFD